MHFKAGHCEGSNFLFYTLAPVGPAPESLEKLLSREMRPFGVASLCWDCQREEVISKQVYQGCREKLALLKMLPGLLPSSVMKTFVMRLGGMPPLQQLRETTHALNQETHEEFLNLDSFD